MEKKLPEIFHNKIDKKLENNKSVFYSRENESRVQKENNEYSKENKLNIYQKINQIFSSPNYVYKADVFIKLRDKEITTKIIGRNENFLITMDNQLIPITDIIDITKKTNYIRFFIYILQMYHLDILKHIHNLNS